MNKFWIMLTHTYMNRLKSKSFLITTGVTLLLVIGLANFQTIAEKFTGSEGGDSQEVAVIGDKHSLIEPLQNQLDMQKASVDLAAFDGSKQEAEQAVQDGEYQAFVELTAENEIPSATFYANQIANTTLSNKIRDALQQLKVMIAADQADIDPAVFQQISSPVHFDTIALEENAKTEEELSEARGLVYVMLFVMYFAVLMYGNMIAMEVATEKSSRVMEILISSASPVAQMFAKIIGVALLGLTQLTLFMVVGFQAVKMNQDVMTGGIFEYFGLDDLKVSLFIYLIVFFILGYLLYATLAAMLGSLVSRLEDAQQLIAPMTLVIVAAFMIAMFGLNAPDSGFVTVTSFIPFFTPMLMFLRVGMLDLPFWEVGLSIGILILTILIMAIIGARIYSGGVLMYGKSSSLKDIKAAIQLSKKE
ncbi:ABC-2 type transport system permease protein [Thalassobacillus cyri]|uniref:ABC-2 type transport system permease protein n=1 Tax=Thalassobacillus cyri TaxID=571932 RepID=A0A1H4GKT1_9BACI|nr:ABC transporter permease [Thalassobacillus cyri]SEB09242.1 ABC-2 type transport system permease protein [Thalassobacillus cyri]